MEEKKNNMKCPYCGKDMMKGKIYGDRYQMKWMPDSQKLLGGIFVHGDYIPLGGSKLTGRTSVEAMYCGYCHKLIIDLLK